MNTKNNLKEDQFESFLYESLSKGQIVETMIPLVKKFKIFEYIEEIKNRNKLFIEIEGITCNHLIIKIKDKTFDVKCIKKEYDQDNMEYFCSEIEVL